MKRYYQCKSNKVVVPFAVNLYEIGDYMSEYAYKTIREFSEVFCFSVTVECEAEDKDTGYAGGYRIDDFDVAPICDDLVLFRDTITGAIESYVYDNEETILGSSAVSDAFNYFASVREHALEEASMDKYYNVVSR